MTSKNHLPVQQQDISCVNNAHQRIIITYGYVPFQLGYPTQCLDPVEPRSLNRSAPNLVITLAKGPTTANVTMIAYQGLDWHTYKT